MPFAATPLLLLLLVLPLVLPLLRKQRQRRFSLRLRPRLLPTACWRGLVKRRHLFSLSCVVTSLLALKKFTLQILVVDVPPTCPALFREIVLRLSCHNITSTTLIFTTLFFSSSRSTFLRSPPVIKFKVPLAPLPAPTNFSHTCWCGEEGIWSNTRGLHALAAMPRQTTQQTQCSSTYPSLHSSATHFTCSSSISSNLLKAESTAPNLPAPCRRRKPSVVLRAQKCRRPLHQRPCNILTTTHRLHRNKHPSELWPNTGNPTLIS